MRSIAALVLAASVLASSGCSLSRGGQPRVFDTGGAVREMVLPAATGATLAQIYAWRAKPGRFDEYTRYIRDVAEPIDHEAQRVGAFVSVTR